MAKRKKKSSSGRLLATRGNSTAEEIASSLGVFPGMLYQWRKQLSAEPLPAAGESYEEEARRLRKENLTLKNVNCALREGHESMSTKSALGVTESCRLLGVPKSSCYDQPVPDTQAGSAMSCTRLVHSRRVC